MCDVLEVSRSGYYSWANQAFPSARSLENKKLSQEIHLIFLEHKGRYGSRRIRRVLINKSQGLHCKTKRKFRQTTDSNHDLPIAPNLLKRDFSPANPNQAYVGDITYIPTQEGWLYLAVVIDLFSRQVVGWSMNERMKSSLVNDSLLMAIWQRKPAKGLISHTDRGSQYASHSHRELLKLHGIKQSMSRKGNCWDNAVAEDSLNSLW